MRIRQRILVKGVVQGVGFRPFIYQLAKRHELAGWVLNSSEGVVIEAEGAEESVNAFFGAITSEAPPLASVESVQATPMSPNGSVAFEIRHSLAQEGKFILVSPDIATCDDCTRELFDPRDRRHRYPFINCTNCGPRFTIIEDIPYDRPLTTMKKFTMCPNCQAEYDDPGDRRFHAQPNACPVCGPKLELKANMNLDGDLQTMECDDPIAETIRRLRAGAIVAIKGLGGFHLACDAEDEAVVTKLRERKHRWGKPLAIMLADLDAVRRHCEVSEKEAEVLLTPQRPIVLLRMKPETTVARGVAWPNKYLGAMLPYTPLHHLILKESGMALVMTSGNLSEEPIAMENDEAAARLRELADFFLTHDRDIYSRYDDSVVRILDGEMTFIRRARSYAPYPVHLPFESEQILACGPEQKNTFCITKENYAFLSQHIGDMENMETLVHFERTMQLYERLFRLEPRVVAYDLHPEYLSTKFAKDLKGVELVGVQHHHAHVVSCMVENGVEEPVIGVSFDGTGYGTDGTIWGGEILVSDWADFERKVHLRYVPMPGGAQAIRHPYRMALGYLFALFGEEAVEAAPPAFWKRIPDAEKRIVERQVKMGLNSPPTSSAGRLFDAVSSLIGIRDSAVYEGQAAVELEMAAEESERAEYRFDITEPKSGGGAVAAGAVAAGAESGTRADCGSGPASVASPALVIDTKPVVEGAIADLRNGVSTSIISAKFHNTVAAFITETCRRIAIETGLETVALTGGVFQNALLFLLVKPMLEAQGLRVIYQRLVPPNDGGISLGQAVVAHARLNSAESGAS